MSGNAVPEVYGVKVKTTDFPRGRWLTPHGTLTQRRLHMGTDTLERASEVAARIAKHPDVERAWAEKF